MQPSLSTSYILPAIVLNPILFLHSLNALLARILPPIIIDAAVQPPPYYPRGPSAEHPHLNVHASDRLCWGYTVFMVCAQLAAFDHVSKRREERKERARLRRERPPCTRDASTQESSKSVNGFAERATADNTLLMMRLEATMMKRAETSCKRPDELTSDDSDESYPGSTDSETIL